MKFELHIRFESGELATRIANAVRSVFHRITGEPLLEDIQPGMPAKRRRRVVKTILTRLRNLGITPSEGELPPPKLISADTRTRETGWRFRDYGRFK